MAFPDFPTPIVLAPMAGGPSTPALVATVSNAGGFGFLAAGYLSPEAVRAELAEARRLTSRPFGLNVFVPSSEPVDDAAVKRYAARLEAEAQRLGVGPGVPRGDDDGWAAKVELAIEAQVAVVSFTFGCPPRNVIERLHAAGSSVWVTVTEPTEALVAAEQGADALVVQGVEAGGHRGSWSDEEGTGELALLPLLRLIAGRTRLPLVATGGLADGSSVAAVLAAGARAAQLGTAFLRCPEAGTSAAHREALARDGSTAITRAFTGRRARGIVNRFMREHSAQAPSAYPHVHHLTAPLRAAARKAGDADGFNLWAGQGFALAEEAPAAELMARWRQQLQERGR